MKYLVLEYWDFERGFGLLEIENIKGRQPNTVILIIAIIALIIVIGIIIFLLIRAKRRKNDSDINYQQDINPINQNQSQMISPVNPENQSSPYEEKPYYSQ